MFVVMNVNVMNVNVVTVNVITGETVCDFHGERRETGGYGGGWRMESS